MCSRRWEMPVMPALSCLEPTRYQTAKATTGERRTSWIRTFRPFSRVVSKTEGAGAPPGVTSAPRYVGVREGDGEGHGAGVGAREGGDALDVGPVGEHVDRPDPLQAIALSAEKGQVAAER